ncbi:MAG: mechanosensitive ion channel [Nitrospiraceae bacterium]|nr:MAG: mechanosensitive ion channel [Nitrospiraceae bacterium]UCH45861.1 MAG: mechanosensitive ion channel [Nitrospiraceae bacterium]
MELKDIYEMLKAALQFQLFTLNQTPVTLMSIVLFLGIFIILFTISGYIVRALRSKVLPRFHLEESIIYNISRVIHYTLLIMSAAFAFQFIGIDFSGLVVVFGFLSVGIGFGLQNITSNFISGLILLFERPIKIGDRVTVGGTEGDVVEIKMRSTVIRSLNNISIIVPNSEFVSAQVVNWSHGDPRVRVEIHVGVSYKSDLQTVLRCLREVADEHDSVLKDPKPFVRLMEFGDSSWNMFLGAWIRDPGNYYQIRSELNCAIVEKFRNNDVEIPFPQRDLHIRSPLPVPFASQ